MAIGGDYPSPVQVNGFACHNCTEVDEAKKHIDPAHPKDGPFGVDAPPERKHGPSVILDGKLAELKDGAKLAQKRAQALGGAADLQT